jgi:release factor glutamine methyltransferase
VSRSLRAALRETERRLEAAGVPEARLEARLLLELATGLPRTAQITAPDRPVAAAEEERLAGLLERRLAGEPFAYIAGRREFHGRMFEVGPAVLVPRPESELLVDLALARLAGRRRKELRILDIGTGSGCLLVSLLTELPAAFGVGTDLSFPALLVARRNARTHGVADRAGFVCTDCTAALAGPFDLVVANPPYLTDDELAFARNELRAEPRLALAGGADGLDVHRAIAADLPRILAADGIALVELAAMRAEATAAVFEATGLRAASIERDLAGLPRALVVEPGPAADHLSEGARPSRAASSTSDDQRN